MMCKIAHLIDRKRMTHEIVRIQQETTVDAIRVAQLFLSHFWVLDASYFI